MLKAKDVAMYFLQLDVDKTLFNRDTLMELNGRRFYEGNARLNKYLHLAQNIYIAKESELLFADPIYAYDNGGIVKDVMENYAILLAQRDNCTVSIPEETKVFLRKLFNVLREAPVCRLIDLSHEDPAWMKKHMFYNLDSQRMEPLKMIEDYRERYEDILEYMDRMPA